MILGDDRDGPSGSVRPSARYDPRQTRHETDRPRRILDISMIVSGIVDISMIDQLIVDGWIVD
jgi:hypothetical protein